MIKLKLFVSVSLRATLEDKFRPFIYIVHYFFFTVGLKNLDLYFLSSFLNPSKKCFDCISIEFASFSALYIINN